MQFFTKEITKIKSLISREVSHSALRILTNKLPLYISIFLSLVVVTMAVNVTWKLIYPVNNFLSNFNNNLVEKDIENIYSNLSGDPFIMMQSLPLNQAFKVQAPPTTLSLRLYGIRYSDSGELDAAILGFDPNNQRLYKTNEIIADDIFLEFIEPERVIISRGGIRESVTFDKNAVFPPEITKSFANQDREIIVDGINASSLSQLMSFQPYFSNGTLKGYQVRPGKQEDLFESTGLKSGDVIVAVNGLDINDPSVLKELTSIGQLKLDLIRDDNDFSITVKLN